MILRHAVVVMRIEMICVQLPRVLCILRSYHFCAGDDFPGHKTNNIEFNEYVNNSWKHTDTLVYKTGEHEVAEGTWENTYTWKFT